MSLPRTINLRGYTVKAGEEYPGDATNPAALKRILQLGLASFGVGAAARSITGLRDLVSKPLQRRRPPRTPAVIEVGVPTVEEEENGEVKPPRRSLFKFGGDKEPPYFVPPIDKSHFETKAPGFLSYLLGRQHANEFAKPYVIPGATLAGLGGLYGGYKAVDLLSNYLHKRDRSSELEAAKDDYRKALVEQYTPDSSTVKRSALASNNNSLGAELDDLYRLVKKADLHDLGGMGTGGYLTLASLLALGSGAGMYNWAKSKSPNAGLAEAIKQRERLRWASRPPEIYAVTKPVPVKVTSKDKDRDLYLQATDEDKELVNKYAALKKFASLYKP